MTRVQPPTHFNINENIYAPYGKAIAYFSHIEDRVAMMCYDYLIHTYPIGEHGQLVVGMDQLRYRMLSSKISYAEMVDILKRILIELYPLKKDDIRTLTNRLIKAGETRNSLLHGQLVSEHLIYFSRNGTASIKQMGIQELNTISDEFLDLHDEVIWFQENYLD